MNNLTWLYEHDETFGNVCYVFGEFFNGDDTRDTREWLMAEHKEQNEFVNCGKPFGEGDVVLDSAVIRPIRMVDAEHAHLTIDEPQSINNEILSEPSSERNPFFTVADRLGVNCADRTDERIAERMLEELEHAWMELPRDVDGNVLHEGDSVVWVDPEWDDEPTIVVGFLDHRSVFTSKKGWRPDTMTVTDELRLKDVPKEPVTLEVRDEDGNTASETPISTCMSDYEHEPAPKLDMTEYQEPTPYEPYEPSDSREKLLIDLEKLTCKWHDYDGNFMRIYSDVAYAQVKELLDRQAAITKSEWAHVHDMYIADLQSDLAARDKGIERLKRRRDELQVELDELRQSYKEQMIDLRNVRWKEIDELKAKVDAYERDYVKPLREQGFTAHAHGVAQALESLTKLADERGDRAEELQAQVNRLVDELGERQDAARLQAENVALAHDLGECMAERDGLRERIADILAIAKGDE